MIRMANGYLDFNATTPMSAAAMLALTRALPLFANPSSAYAISDVARSALEQARGQVAALIAADPEEITFTSGGTEANNWALKGAIDCLQQTRGHEPMHMLMSAIEHASITETAAYLARCRGVAVSHVRPAIDGVVSVREVIAALRPQTRLVTVMLANNEIGTVQPIQAIAAALRPRGIRLHVDAVQAVGKIPVDAHALGADSLAFSAHKFHGPKGVGGLFVRKGVELEPLLHGGSQEGGRRSGTEALAGIIATGVAAAECAAHLSARARSMARRRDELRTALTARVPGVVFHGPSVQTPCLLPNTLNLRVTGIRAEALVALLDCVHGFQVSLASACSNNKEAGLSHVLVAMGLTEQEIRSTLRISLGSCTNKVELTRLVDAMVSAVALLHSISAREGDHVQNAA
jgi:cysteine desulfurase